MPATVPARADVQSVFGRIAGYLAVAALIVVLAVMAVLHPEVFQAGRGFLFAIELLLVVQLSVVVLWLGMRSDG